MSGKDKHHSSTHQEISHLELWLSEGAGVTLHDTERAICDELLPNYYGDVLLQAVSQAYQSIRRARRDVKL